MLTLLIFIFSIVLGLYGIVIGSIFVVVLANREEYDNLGFDHFCDKYSNAIGGVFIVALTIALLIGVYWLQGGISVGNTAASAAECLK